MPTHSPAAAGYLLPAEYRRSCLEMDLVAAYRNFYELLEEAPWMRREVRRHILSCRRQLIACFSAHGWKAEHIRELRRGATMGMRCFAPGVL